jgi:UDP-3-O-acyl-N-acetylglucosamine deacetylase
VLDVVGDLALTGCEVIGHIVAYRSGHRLHAELARLLREQITPEAHQFEASALRRCA